MSNRIHALAQQLTGKKSIEDCSLDELRHVAKRHPYYAPAQFLLLQKLRSSGTPEEAEAQYRKAVLFYHDPLLFDYFISSHEFFIEESLAADGAELENDDLLVLPEVDISEENNNTQPQVSDDPLGTMAVQIDDESIAQIPELEETAETAIITNESVTDDELVTAKTEVAAEPFVSNAQDETAPLTSIELTAEQDLPANPPAKAPDVAFEPFHTVDYFASQGIKISQEEAPKDKLGKQLKSFTEWLKTMKRLPASQMTQTAESSAEKKVETLASHSVSESDVVTEAMAEVWQKQGNTQKALDIYNKLSLQNPSKKAYFAAKIDHLKQS